MGFVLAAAIGLAVVLVIGRHGLARSKTYPWQLYATANMHVGIMGGLAGVAFTGVVLVVTLAHDRPGTMANSLDTVIVMFLVAFLWWVGNAFLISYIPHDETSGELVPRVHFSLASTIEYRTVFLSWFALLPLLEANGFGRLASCALLSFARIAAVRVRPDCNVYRWPGLVTAMGNVSFRGRGNSSCTWIRCHRYAGGSRRPVAVLRAVHHACHLLHQRPGFFVGSAHAAVTAIRRHKAILQAKRQADCRCRHATDNGVARVSLALRGRGGLNWL